jgi:voltage-gated potassium channel Kch
MYPELAFYKIVRKLRVFSPIIIFLIAVLIFVLGFYGYYNSMYATYEQALLKDPTLKFDFDEMGAFYAIISMFLMESIDNPVIPNWQLALAKYLAALLLGYGIFITIYRYVYSTWVNFKIKNFYSEHTVVLGLGNIGYKIALEMLKADKKVVIIDNNPHNEHLVAVQAYGGLAIIGSALEKDDLIRAGIEKASYCIVSTGHDEINLEAAHILSQMNQQGRMKGHLKVHVNINDWYNVNFLKDYLDLYTKTENFDIDSFDTDLSAAQMIFDTYSPVAKVTYTQVISQETSKMIGVTSSDNAIAVVGFNSAAENFIVECIILTHVPGLRNLKVILIDIDVKNAVKQLRLKFPFIDEYIDLIPYEMEDENFQSPIFESEKFVDYLKILSHAYFFGNHDAYLMGLANRFRQLLYATIDDMNVAELIVCLPEKSKIMSIIDPNPEDKTKEHLFDTLQKGFNIHVVNQITDTCTKAKLIDDVGIVLELAKMVNYFYAAKYEFEWLLPENDRKTYQALGLGDILEKIFLAKRFTSPQPTDELQDAILGEMAKALNKDKKDLLKTFGIHVKWNQLSDIKQDSNRYVARHLDVKINFLSRMGHTDFTKDVIESYLKVFAPIEHKRWNSEKQAFKFRYGKFPKDKKQRNLLKEMLKIHDQIIPYDALDKEMEDKDLNMFLLIPVMQSAKNAVMQRN